MGKEKHKWIIMIGLMIISVALVGCAEMISSAMPGPKAFHDKLGDNRYEIRAYKNLTASAYQRWEVKASELCGEKGYETEDRQFVQNPDGMDYVIGIANCK